MTESHTRKLNRIALISAPWPLFDHPSIQIATLKAWLQTRFPNISTDAHHFYLRVAEAVGYPVYKAISKRTWLSEVVYGTLLYPEHRNRMERLFQKEAKATPVLQRVGLARLSDQVRQSTHQWIDAIPWSQYGMVGISICLCQLTASLYLIRCIEKHHSDLPIVAGGSLMTEPMARSLLNWFPQIDAIVVGEGEQPLAAIVDHLQIHGSISNMPEMDGIITRTTDPSQSPVSFCQLTNLDALPPPDYTEYVQTLREFSPAKRFFPTLPVEISRGCWWHKKQPGTTRSGCAFCNLNLQWKGYRAKSPERAASEILHLSKAHQSLSIRITDNVLPQKSAATIFNKIRESGNHLKLFCEIRASTPLSSLKAMRDAGVHEVQIGIEALSSGLLKKLNKGTTAIQNIEMMKYCEELGIRNISNLLTGFPGSDESDVAETLRALDFVYCFRPLRVVTFWLGVGSAVFHHPKQFGIQAIANHPNYGAIFPREMVSDIPFMIQTYRGDRQRQQKLWAPVRQKVRQWKRMYRQLHGEPWSGPILSYRQGDGFLMIRQRRLNGDPMNHRLTGPSRDIYLFCRQHRSFEAICHHVPEMASQQVSNFLKMMVKKRLMFEETGQFLSLAVKAHSVN